MSSFDSATFTRLLATASLGRDLALYPTLPSTMDAAHEALAKGAPHGHLVLTETQTRGRGRRGQAWLGSPARHLTFSLVLRDVNVDGLTLTAGLAIARTIERLIEAPVAIKWPNDVWVGTPARKVAGVLVEARAAGIPRDVVMGIGLNVGHEHWPADLEATSLEEHASTATREEVLATLLAELERSLRELRREGVAAIARQVDTRLLWRGTAVVCDDTVGQLQGLDPNGGLVLDTPTGQRTLRAGVLRPATRVH